MCPVCVGDVADSITFYAERRREVRKAREMSPTWTLDLQRMLAESGVDAAVSLSQHEMHVLENEWAWDSRLDAKCLQLWSLQMWSSCLGGASRGRLSCAWLKSEK